MIILKVTMTLQDDASPVRSKASAGWKEQIKLGDVNRDAGTDARFSDPKKMLRAVVQEFLMRGAISTSKQLVADTDAVIEAAMSRFLEHEEPVAAGGDDSIAGDQQEYAA